VLASAEYPPRLRDLERPPEVVHVTGELPRGHAAAIVGTREPTSEAEAFAYELARGLADRDVVVYSGGALGIDTAAHRGALASGGRTVVVAPSSFDCPFPEENGSLFEQIVEGGGAFLTTHPPGTPAARHHFFARNHVLAALVDVLVMVESRYRGGARNALKAARRLGRKVLVVPGSPWNPKASGCLLEIRNGAPLATSVDDVLIALGLPKRAGAAPVRPARRSVFLEGQDPDRFSVLAALENGSIDVDALCQATGLGAARVQAMLLTLTLEGIVVSGPSGRVSLVSV